MSTPGWKRLSVVVDGMAHEIAIPTEWSGGLAIVVNVHRGYPSRKILVGKLASIILTRDGDDRGPRLEPGSGPAMGGTRQEEKDGGTA